MSKRSILIVEDEGIVAEDLAEVLRHMGHEVAGITTTGEEAVEFARNHRPALILMDIHLAGDMDGIEAAQQIHRECQLPVLFLTAHSDPSMILLAQQTGALGYILKPFDEYDLRLQIEMALIKHAADQRMRESDKRLALSMSAAQIGMFGWDLTSGSILWTQTQEAIFGPTSSDGTNPATIATKHDYHRWAKPAHPEDLPLVEETSDRCLQDNKPLEVQHWITWPDGSVHWIETKGVFCETTTIQPADNRIVGVTMKIAERERGEDLATILDVVPTPVIITHDPEATHMTGNRAANELLRQSSGTELSLSADSEVKPSHFKTVKDGRELMLDELLAQRAARGEHVRDFEFDIVFNDGTTRHLLSYGKPLMDEQSHPRGAVHVLVDITERKRVEEQLHRSLAEKEVLLREIHHRVKNNLQVISSLINLQSAGLTDEKMRDEFNNVRDRVRSMALIHEKMYQTSNLAQLNFADYAADLLGSLWRSHGKLAEKVRLNLEVAPVSLSIKTAVPCGLILNELAGNALKHAFPNGCDGEVTVSMEHHPSADTVCLRVRDNGVGLPAIVDWRQPSSLGLRLVRLLAAQLHGTVETGSGPGAEFHITFPLNEAQS
jgi:two-component system, sensor histidine kinase PdtaS